ncbi:MAG: DUF5718 family protein [Planctomycetota bacterium]
MIDLKQAIGLGVAGNFTGHLEQAGEASDFTDVVAAEGAPKGVFPFYVPPANARDMEHFLYTFPLSTDTLEHPGDINGQPANLQIEPELALLCVLQYADDAARSVTSITPTHFAAYNDCSTRRPDADKISQKKNWGPNTKGLASDQWIALDTFAPGGVLDRFRLACYLLRDGALHTYGEDSPIAGPRGYGYMHGQLLDWLVERLNTQADHGPLENLADWFRIADHPTHAVVSIGATRYTEFGETTYLQPDDEAIVVAYDSEQHDVDAALLIRGDDPLPAGSASVLRQRVVARGA